MNQCQEQVKSPDFYLSTSGGKWRVIYKEMPMCADTDKETAYTFARKVIERDVKLCRLAAIPLWDGEAGKFTES